MPHAMLTLELAGIDRLFKVFDTVEDAVKSFDRRMPQMQLHVDQAVPQGRQPSANAA
jgi:hypothetical protein